MSATPPLTTLAPVAGLLRDRVRRGVMTQAAAVKALMTWAEGGLTQLGAEALLSGLDEEGGEAA